jgi:hypothetical protein
MQMSNRGGGKSAKQQQQQETKESQQQQSQPNEAAADSEASASSSEAPKRPASVPRRTRSQSKKKKRKRNDSDEENAELADWEVSNRATLIQTIIDKLKYIHQKYGTTFSLGYRHKGDIHHKWKHVGPDEEMDEFLCANADDLFARETNSARPIVEGKLSCVCVCPSVSPQVKMTGMDLCQLATRQHVPRQQRQWLPLPVAD